MEKRGIAKEDDPYLDDYKGDYKNWHFYPDFGKMRQVRGPDGFDDADNPDDAMDVST